MAGFTGLYTDFEVVVVEDRPSRDLVRIIFSVLESTSTPRKVYRILLNHREKEGLLKLLMDVELDH